MINKYEDIEIDDVRFYDDAMIIDWSGKIGFGQLTITRSCLTDEYDIDTEYLGDTFYQYIMSLLPKYIYDHKYARVS